MPEEWINKLKQKPSSRKKKAQNDQDAPEDNSHTIPGLFHGYSLSESENNYGSRIGSFTDATAPVNASDNSLANSIGTSPVPGIPQGTLPQYNTISTNLNPTATPPHPQMVYPSYNLQSTAFETPLPMLSPGYSVQHHFTPGPNQSIFAEQTSPHEGSRLAHEEIDRSRQDWNNSTRNLPGMAAFATGESNTEIPQGSMSHMTQEQLYQFRQNWVDSTQGLSGIAASAAEESNIGHPHDLMHNCTCGPKCNCVACSVHPYNEATRQHLLNGASHLIQHNFFDGQQWNQSSMDQASYGIGHDPTSAIVDGNEVSMPTFDSGNFNFYSANFSQAEIEQASLGQPLEPQLYNFDHAMYRQQ